MDLTRLNYRPSVRHAERGPRGPIPTAHSKIMNRGGKGEIYRSSEHATAADNCTPRRKFRVDLSLNRGKSESDNSEREREREGEEGDARCR